MWRWRPKGIETGSGCAAKPRRVQCVLQVQWQGHGEIVALEAQGCWNRVRVHRAGVALGAEGCQNGVRVHGWAPRGILGMLQVQRTTGVWRGAPQGKGVEGPGMFEKGSGLKNV